MRVAAGTSPLLQAQMKLAILAHTEDLQPITRIGGSLTQEEVLENERRQDLRIKHMLDIIREHGLETDFIAKAEQETRDSEAIVNKNLAIIRENEILIAALSVK